MNMLSRSHALPVMGWLLALMSAGNLAAAEGVNSERTLDLSGYVSQDVAPMPPVLQSGLPTLIPLQAPALAPSNSQAAPLLPQPMPPASQASPPPPMPLTLQGQRPSSLYAEVRTMNGCSDGSCGPPAIGLRPAGGFAPCWIVDLGTIGLTRVPTGAQTVVTDGLQNPLLGSQDLNSGWRFGPWLDVTRQFDCWGLEFLYFSVDGFSDGASFGGTVLSPLFPAVNLDSLNLAYSSRLYNGEINATTALAKHINLLAGFRWIQLDEELDGIGTAGAQFGTATQTVSTNLYGFQLGAEGHLLDDRGPWRLSAFAKAGVYGAHSAGVFNATFGPGSMQVAESDNHVAFVGETGVNLAYHVCSHVSLFAGYEALWIDGVSLAPDTLANGALTQTTAFYHGATAGLEFRW